MNPRRIAIKLFTTRNVGVHELSPFIGVFHRFIQQASVPGLLIDVADYAHVPDGPGVILIGHDVDYGIDRVGGRSGLLATRKRAGDLALPELFRDTLAMAVATARAIEDDDDADLEFAGDEILVTFPDRLALPNTAEAGEAATKELEPVAREIFGDGARVTAEPPEDPRRMLALRVETGGADWKVVHAALEAH